MNILLLGGGLQGLCCGASLYGKGHRVDVISSDLQIRYSKYFDTVYKDICDQNEEVYDILGMTDYDVIIPMGDIQVSFLSRNKQYIESNYRCRCACPCYDVLSIVEDKHLFMSFCADNNVPHPKTAPLPPNLKSYDTFSITYPALIKPDFSVGARGITKVLNYYELLDKYPQVKERFGKCTIQEYIDNKDYYYNVMLYRDRNGNFLAHAIIKIVRMYPIHAGSSTCCISVNNPQLLQICKDCLDKLNWVGIADFDVLQRLDNQEFKIIEINPRVPASLKGALISGVNFPEIIALDAIGLESPMYKYSPGKILRYLGTDILWFMASKDRFKTTPSWISFIGKNIFYQDIYREDCSTWWTWFAEGIQKFWRHKNKQL